MKIIKIIWFFSFTSFITIFILLIYTIYGGFGDIPSIEDLENPKYNLASEIWSEDGYLLGTFYKENRSCVQYDDISINAINALIATEDKRFYDHYGIDFKRMMSSILLTLYGYKQGGSTISQQLALNLYDKRSSNYIGRIIQKIKEIIIAVRLEKFYTKNEIISMYLNTVNYGNNSYGIKMASYSYFNTTPELLGINQSALLIGLINAPTRYSPIKNYNNALTRKNIVLNLMYKNGYINKDILNQYLNENIDLNINPTQHDDGIAPYFREMLRLNIKNEIENNNLINNYYKYYDIYKDGLKIYTTINFKMQKYAEESLKEYLYHLQITFNNHLQKREKILENTDNILKYLNKSNIYKYVDKNKVNLTLTEKLLLTNKNTTLFSWYHKNNEFKTFINPLDSYLYYKNHLIGSLLSINPKNGSIKAWVGGINYRFFKFDMVKNGKRQLGSIFKPIVYAEAIENFNFDIYMKIPNVPISFDKYKNNGGIYTPYNADYSIGGIYTLYEGFVKSLNTTTMYLVKHVGPKNIIKRAINMGINAQFQPYPSIGLGVFESSLHDIVEAYSSFYNKGIKNNLYYIDTIKDCNNNIIYLHKQLSQEVMNEKTANDILKMLMGTVSENTGTARRLRLRYNFKNVIAAKTGTTDNQSDGWFIGGVPNLLTGIWVGGDDKTLYWDNITLGQGANTALPIWALYMKKIYNDNNINLENNFF
ncbi:MAG: penicillin-binding protein [Bacteroides sp.]|nr:MAG: penicillin-binding protein [Bacteroides sp.]